MELKSHFIFNRQQRSGIFLLLLLLISLLCFYWFVDFTEEDSFDISSPEIVSLQNELDSLRLIGIEKRKPKLYPFNPNYITDFKGYTLGMSTEEIDRLLKYRAKGKWVNSVADFKNVTLVSDSLLDEISPYFKFPDWVTNPKTASFPHREVRKSGFEEISYHQKTDLNKATAEELQKVNGIGPALSLRIIAYRDKLNGFSNDLQLYEVYGLDDAVVKRILNLFTVKEPKSIVKMNINKASASDIATIPGISFDLAKKIWEFRKLRDKISSFEELSKIEGLTERKLQLIQLYLSIE